MNVTVRSASARQALEHFDILIVGAGISGVGSAYHLTKQLPGSSFVVLEEQETFGGTWWTHKYPGIRSDSDLHTFGYSFKPWREAKAIADGPSILNYVREAAAEYGVDDHIRFGHRATRASWSSEDAAWTVEAVRADTGETVRFTCNFLLMCAGVARRTDQRVAVTHRTVEPRRQPRMSGLLSPC